MKVEVLKKNMMEEKPLIWEFAGQAVFFVEYVCFVGRAAVMFHA